MLQRLVILVQFWVGLCFGSGVNFIENDIFVQLRSKGHVTVGYIGNEDTNQDYFHDQFSMKFKNLRFLTPHKTDLYMFRRGSELWDIQESAFDNMRGIDARGMSMILDVRVLGVVLNITGTIFKEDGKLSLGDGVMTDVKQGEVLVTLTLTPASDLDLNCLPCNVDDGYVIQLGLYITHEDNTQYDDVIEYGVFNAYNYDDHSTIFLPNQYLSDGSMKTLDINITQAGSTHKIVTRLPTPLGDRVEMSFIFKVKKPNVQSTTSPEPVTTERSTTPTTTKEDKPRDADRARDTSNMVDDDVERIIDVKYITMTTSRPMTIEGSVEDTNKVIADRDSENNAGLSHYISYFLLYLVSIIVYTCL